MNFEGYIKLSGLQYTKSKEVIDRNIKAWAKSIRDCTLQDRVLEAFKIGDLYVTGGSVLSAITGSKLNDFDVYCSDPELVRDIVKYFNTDAEMVSVIPRGSEYAEEGLLFVEGIDPDMEGFIDLDSQVATSTGSKKDCALAYRSSSAYSFNNGVQLITRFVGSPEQIHKFFDFTICKGVYFAGEFYIKPEHLQHVAERQLVYDGSMYPLATLFRIPKYLNRGYRIRHLTQVKIAVQLSELNLGNPKVLRDQLNGVDQVYTKHLLEAFEKLSDLSTSFICSLIDEMLANGQVAYSSVETEDSE